MLSGCSSPPAISRSSELGAAEWWRSTSTAPLASLVIASASTSKVVISTLTPYLRLERGDDVGVDVVGVVEHAQRAGLGLQAVGDRRFRSRSGSRPVSRSRRSCIGATVHRCVDRRRRHRRTPAAAEPRRRARPRDERPRDEIPSRAVEAWVGHGCAPWLVRDRDHDAAARVVRYRATNSATSSSLAVSSPELNALDATPRWTRSQTS